MKSVEFEVVELWYNDIYTHYTLTPQRGKILSGITPLKSGTEG